MTVPSTTLAAKSWSDRILFPGFPKALPLRDDRAA